MSETTHDSRPERAAAAHDAAVAPEVAAPTMDALAAPADRLLADPHVGERANGPVRIAALQRMQHTYGNRATARWLNAGRAAVQREDVDTAPAPTQAAPAGPAGAMTQATQEAEAAQTLASIQSTQQKMLQDSNPTMHNTARLFTPQLGRPARLSATPMTLRSDNAALIAAAGQSPTTTGYFFYGTQQNNQHTHTPNAVGTIDNNTIVVRGKDSAGNVRGYEDLASTFTHEASHILVASYGEHPKTATDASSFDRYKDEFRAYWIEPVGYWAKMKPNDDKAHAIRDHMVGKSAVPTSGYPDLQNQYWFNPPFKAQVDAHLRPDGFNLTNSPGLDVLFQRISAVQAGTGRLEDVRAQILRLEPAESAEAANSTLVQNFLKSLPADDATLIRNTLAFGARSTTAHDLNPTDSPRVRALLDAFEQNPTDAGLKASYAALTAAEKSAALMTPALLIYIDLRLPNVEQRAAMYAMLATGQPGQFDAMQRFLDACRTVIANSTSGTVMNDVPPEITTTLRAVAYEARLALYRLVEPARQAFVDLLPQPLANKVLHALREDGDP